MKIYTISLFSHRKMTGPHTINKALAKEIDLIRTKEYVDFVLGRGGNFYIPAA